MHQIEKFQSVQVSNRSMGARKTIHDVCTVVQDMLKEVEAQEPRFISSLSEINGRYDGLRVISPTEFEVVLYLNQMGEFNFVDDGSMPGCAVLKLSDGRKRSMSLGGVHHGQWLLVRQEDPLQVPDSCVPGLRQVLVQRLRQDDERRERGEDQDQGEVRCPDHSGLQVPGSLAEVCCSLAQHDHGLAPSKPRGHSQAR